MENIDGHNIEDVTTGCRDFRYVVVGMISNNVYFVDDGAGGVVVCDPSADADLLLKVAGERPVSAILITHEHTDHTGAARALREATGAPVYCSDVAAPAIEQGSSAFGLQSDPCPVDVRLHDGDAVTTGAITWRCVSTPGHTPGGMCFYLDAEHAALPEGTDLAEAGKPILLSGDTLFHASMGRTDLPGGSDREMAASLKRLGEFPDETIVLPGHNALTTIKLERWRIIDFFPKYAGLE